MRAPVALWDETFRLPFHLFRAEVTDLARQNWESLEGVVVALEEDVPEGALVLPTDDDDWFSPRVGPTLEGAAAAVPRLGYRWPTRHLEVPLSARNWFGSVRRQWFPNTRPRVLCASNGYALVKRTDTADLLRYHTRASRWFAANPTLVESLQHPLSLTNRTLGSMTQFVLRGRFDRVRLLSKYRAYVRCYQHELAPDLRWATPYVRRMGELMSELSPR